MPVFARSFTSRFARHSLTWLLAFVLPLQGVAVGVFTVMGPAHMHKVADTEPVLTDIRRWKPTSVRHTELLASVGHTHGSAALKRHHHAYDDRSVLRTAEDGPLSGADADDGPSASATLASVLALPPAVSRWVAPEVSDPLASRARWASLTRFVEPLDRPPRAG